MGGRSRARVEGMGLASGRGLVRLPAGPLGSLPTTHTGLSVPFGGVAPPTPNPCTYTHAPWLQPESGLSPHPQSDAPTRGSGGRGCLTVGNERRGHTSLPRLPGLRRPRLLVPCATRPHCGGAWSDHMGSLMQSHFPFA